MSANKRLIRNAFRTAVFARDSHKCRKCGNRGPLLDAHHIIDRNLLPNGGYTPMNGITLCQPCHRLAEVFHETGTPAEGFAPTDLFALIGSDEARARTAALRLK